LDQNNLDTDLKEFAEYAWSCLLFAGESNDTRIVSDLDEWLNSINPNLGKKMLPGLKQLWKSGDLREKLVASNAQISSIRARWQVRGVFGFRMDRADYHYPQTRLQVCTFASTTAILGRMDSAHTETTALFQQVLTMLQQAPVRQGCRTLSMHSQAEPAAFNSQTTRVGSPPMLVGTY